MMHGWKSDASKARRLVVLGALSALLWVPIGVWAQTANQFGGQQRADAASKMIVLGVQQGISSLPPTSGQSLLYEFNPELDTYVTSERLGPTSFRAPQTVGAGKFSFRVAASYFELADTFAPITYEVFNNSNTTLGIAQLGLRVNAHVGLLNVATTYGITNRIEVSINVPLSVVDAQASQVFTTRTTALSNPPSQAPVSGVCIRSALNQGCQNLDVTSARGDLDEKLKPGGGLSYRALSFAATGQQFKTENHLGIGRISLGTKVVLYADPLFQIALAPEFFLPSPNEGSFAGSETASFLPRILGALRVTDYFKLHLDAGYDNDFDNNQLRRFVWDFGASFPFSFATFDAGVGGSKFNDGIKWTPDVAPIFVGTQQVGYGQARDNNKLGDNFIDALGGVKVRLAEKSVLSGAVNVPLNNEGFRAAAVGTVSVEFYF